MAAASRTIYFTGRVQGVGFRQSVVQFSRGLNLAGTVRNLPDGRVELVVSSASGSLEHDLAILIDRLREHFAGFIRKVEHSPGSAVDRQPGSGIWIVS